MSRERCHSYSQRELKLTNNLEISQSRQAPRTSVIIDSWHLETETLNRKLSLARLLLLLICKCLRRNHKKSRVISEYCFKPFLDLLRKRKKERKPTGALTKRRDKGWADLERVIFCTTNVNWTTYFAKCVWRADEKGHVMHWRHLIRQKWKSPFHWNTFSWIKSNSPTEKTLTFWLKDAELLVTRFLFLWKQNLCLSNVGRYS